MISPERWKSRLRRLGVAAALLALASTTAAPVSALLHARSETQASASGLHAPACPDIPTPHGAGCAVCRAFARSGVALAPDAEPQAADLLVASLIARPGPVRSDRLVPSLASPRGPPSLS
jgi:hypothetical protein